MSGHGPTSDFQNRTNALVWETLRDQANDFLLARTQVASFRALRPEQRVVKSVDIYVQDSSRRVCTCCRVCFLYLVDQFADKVFDGFRFVWLGPHEFEACLRQNHKNPFGQSDSKTKSESFRIKPSAGLTFFSFLELLRQSP